MLCCKRKDKLTSDKDAEDAKKKPKIKFSLRQKIALIMLCIADFMSFCSMSIMAPFFPREAAKKGMSETLAGFVFGFYALIIVVSSPVFGSIIPKCGVKLSFTIGLFTSGLCSILFGMLDMVTDYSMFVVLCFVIRGLEALGAGAYSTAGYVIVANLFPDNDGFVRGLLETFVGLGMSAGPAIGGLLFAVGGFGLPFYVIGLIIVVMTPLYLYLIPTLEKLAVEKKTGSFTSLLQLPQVLVTCFILCVVASTWGFLDPTLEPHLRQFDLNPSQVGLVFLLISAMYGIFSPGWGYLADKMDNYWIMMVCGLIMNSLCLLIMGPSPIFSFLTSSIWHNIVALSGLGISVALAQMPTYRSILDCVVNEGYSENIGTHSVIAGLWSGVYSLGEVVGPVMGGALLGHQGFPNAATVFAAINFVTAITTVMFFVRKKKTDSEVTSKVPPILESYKNTDMSENNEPLHLQKISSL